MYQHHTRTFFGKKRVGSKGKTLFPRLSYTGHTSYRTAGCHMADSHTFERKSFSSTTAEVNGVHINRWYVDYMYNAEVAVGTFLLVTCINMTTSKLYMYCSICICMYFQRSSQACSDVQQHACWVSSRAKLLPHSSRLLFSPRHP